MDIIPLLACALFSSTISQAMLINFEDCGSRDSTVVSVKIAPCNILPCVLVKGKPYTIEIKFTARAHIRGGDALLEVVYDGVIKSLPIRASLTCGHLDPPCPIRPGGTYKYSYTTAISHSLPRRLLIVRWQLLRTDEIPFVCVQFPAKIENS
ncbi:hypothetical protein CRM22_004886 [Opisthorchis felineus]|uniref:MD-2-related lipid-recognition domain-containing protein n=1 Tax=Opisthorchis felineus TaxID=147828 RepID=A0A4S2LU12_OPIFE|nr:hypothetical protein CRM22_004886 [Opisthorchis felineus]TGZ67293.1 hypothetical protein CRM22_004886 [Opisthorchis felineus]